MRQSGLGGKAEIRAAFRESRRLLAAIALFSAVVNLLMLTGPLFMLQIYDRVLTSRSEATLVALAAIVAFLFLMMGLLDHARARVLARVGARLQASLDGRVLSAILTRAARSPASLSVPATGLRDLEAMQRFASGPGPFAFFDSPWTPVFVFILFTFHWLLGLLAVLSGVLLLALALMSQIRTTGLRRQASQASAQAFHIAEQMRAGGETVRGLGMRAAAVQRAGRQRRVALTRTLAASDRTGAYAATARALRLFLQSMMLGLGAWLAIRGEVTPGIMIAASILLGRALAPIDQAVAQWPLLQNALAARRSLVKLLSETPEAPARTILPDPQGLLVAERLVVVPPGAQKPAVSGASLRVEPGKAVAVAGPSASGKSCLARALAGVWPAAAGKVTLGGAALDQYDEAALARHVGWLPQDVVLFEGSVAENIARLDPEPDAAAVVDAAKRAGAHEMILDLPGGYDFQVAAAGAAMSGGQRQRVALARALYGSPVMAILDEPDAHLDAAGVNALIRAVTALKSAGGSAVIVAHRPAVFAACDAVYLMENGRLRLSDSENGVATSDRPPKAVDVRRSAPPSGLGSHRPAGRPRPTGPAPRPVTESDRNSRAEGGDPA